MVRSGPWDGGAVMNESWTVTPVPINQTGPHLGQPPATMASTIESPDVWLAVSACRPSSAAACPDAQPAQPQSPPPDNPESCPQFIAHTPVVHSQSEPDRGRRACQDAAGPGNRLDIQKL